MEINMLLASLINVSCFVLASAICQFDSSARTIGRMLLIYVFELMIVICSVAIVYFLPERYNSDHPVTLSGIKHILIGGFATIVSYGIIFGSWRALSRAKREKIKN